jgi:hypothetical protein
MKPQVNEQERSLAVCIFVLFTIVCFVFVNPSHSVPYSLFLFFSGRFGTIVTRMRLWYRMELGEFVALGSITATIHKCFFDLIKAAAG